MSAFSLLLGTRRLRREIDLQAQQLQRDIEHEQFARAQLRQTFVARITSPLGLLSAAGAGFVAGKIGGRSSHAKRAAAQTVASATTLTFAAIRSVAIQAVLPMAIEWVQSKFANRKDDEVAGDTPAKNDIGLPSQK